MEQGVGGLTATVMEQVLLVLDAPLETVRVRLTTYDPGPPARTLRLELVAEPKIETLPLVAQLYVTFGPKDAPW